MAELLYGKEERFRRYIEERQRAQRANAYLTFVVYALVFWCLLGALYCVVEMFFRRRRVTQEERRRERHMRMYQLHQMIRQGLHEE